MKREFKNGSRSLKNFRAGLKAFTFAGVLLATMPGVSASAAANRIEFNRDIRPILSENCFFCHGADANNRKAKLRLDTADGAIAKGVIVPGKPDDSELIKRIFSSDKDDQMPPAESNRHLNPQQKELLRAWIKDGAKYDTHWAFKPPVRPEVPAVKLKKWPRNEIDHFILARLEREKLKPAKEAPIERLLRRVSLDITGLPPSPTQVQKWLKQKDPYAVAVDELLASSHYGERMASDWMDVARYADTHGFNNDSLRTMWRWRDWVIEAFNRNLPYDRFITEQLAGDLLKEPTLDQLIATGFNRNHVINSEGGIIDEEYRVEYVADRVRTTSLAWLGLTMECARCHDHKFDPIKQADYYRMFAFFNSVDELGEAGRIANAAPFIPAPTRKQQDEMTKQQVAMAAAEKTISDYLAARDWKDVRFEDLAKSQTNGETETNRVISLVLDAWTAEGATITNSNGNTVFNVQGKLGKITGPNGHAALIFDGRSRAKMAGLPGFNAQEGWAFSAWVRRDAPQDVALFSTMNFNVPESSQSYGHGIEVRLNERGAVDVRMARRWAGYSAQIVSRTTLPLDEFRHVLVTGDGSEKARGLRIFIDGEECFRDVLQDDFASLAINGTAYIGGSGLKGAPSFKGALADVKLLSKPIEADKLAAAAREAVTQYSATLAENELTTYHKRVLQLAWLKRHVPEVAKADAEVSKARAALLAIERDAPTTMIMRELAKPRPSFILFRGQYDQPREAVEPGVPEFLLPFPENAPRNRLGLAQWFTDTRHPLTGRVIVNRLWQNLFGTGLVKSSEDLGFQSEWPSHPELLDWLAREFVDSGWDMKRLIRLIVTSSTYRQDSYSTPELNERDPDNRLLARGPRLRLTAEMLRDQALVVSGLLHDEIGGPHVSPYQPANFYKGIVVAADYPGTSYTESKGPDLYRRSLYTFWKRTIPHPTLATFDAPDREVCVARRLKTNTPLQALALMNDTIQLEAARKLAERMLLEGGDSAAERIRFGFTLATLRKPDSAEQKLIAKLLENRLAYYRSSAEAAKNFLTIGASPRNESLDVAELAAYANIASLILNLDETITRN